MNTTGAGNRPVERETLYVMWRREREQIDCRPLRNWIADYPEYADDLVRWAAELPLLESMSPFEGEAEEEARLAKVGRAVVAEMRARYGLDRPSVVSLAEAASRRQMRLPDLAKRLGVGMPVVSKLEQRLLQFTTLPETLIHRIAEVLELSAEAVRDYLRQPPTLAAGAAYQYTGAAKPQVQRQESFEEAIRACPGMSDAQKSAWLAETEA